MGKIISFIAVAFCLSSMVGCAYRPIPGGEQAATYRPEAMAGEIAR